MKITNIISRTILDSASQPALEVELELADGRSGKASVPTGISVGDYEKKPVPVDAAIRQIESDLKPVLLQKEIASQEALDKLLESLNLGANVSLAISIAFCRATEYLKTLNFEKTTPRLLMLSAEGGKHAQNNLTFQEFLINVENFDAGRQIYEKLGQVLQEKNIEFEYGQEGGYAPKNLNNEDVLKILSELGAKIGLDIAASSLEQQEETDFEKLASQYPILSIEDPYSQDDWEKWQVLTQKLAEKVLIIGDDLTATNPQRIKKAIELAACNAFIVKPNQIGTVTQTLEVVKLAKMANFKTIISHRAHETKDTFVAELAYYTGADFVKFGAPRQEERLVKYKKLEELM